MSTGLHRHLTQGDIHTIAEWVYADDTARLAATGFVAADLYKMAYQISSGTPWLLTGYSPITWTELAAGSSPNFDKVQVAVIKSTAGTLAVGTAVYVTSWDQANDRAEVEAAKADSATTMPCAGIISVQATDSVEGKAMMLGIIHGVDTSHMVDTDPMYLSHTTAGAITTTPPPGPYVTQALGQCLRSNATTGHLGVNILGYRAYQYAVAAADLGVAAAGTSNLASASDHVHKMPSAADVGAASTTHAPTHKSGGADAIKLDELAAPTDVTTLNATTSLHGLLAKLGGGTTNFLRADGTWAAPSSTPIFGSEFQQAVSEAASNTTSTSYVQKLRMTTPSLPSGTYRIGWSYEWRGSSAADDCEYRVSLSAGATIFSAVNIEPKDPTNYAAISGFIFHTGSGVLNIDIDYASENGDATYIRRARLEIWRVS